MSEDSLINGLFLFSEEIIEALDLVFQTTVAQYLHQVMQTVRFFPSYKQEDICSASDGLKGVCGKLNLLQLIKSSTCPNAKCSSKIITNNPHKFSAVGIFFNFSDRCAIACVGDT